MSSWTTEVIRGLVPAAPLFLIAAADVYFFSQLQMPVVSGYAFVIQFAVLTVAALIMIPNTIVRAVCTAFLLLVSMLGAMTIGLFYLPAVCAGAALTIHQRRVNSQS